MSRLKRIKKNIFSSRNSEEGTSLIELLVAMAIFSLLMIAVSSFFISGIKAQRTNLANQELFNQTSYTLEYVSRALRMATKELDNPPACLSLFSSNYETDDTSITFKNYQGQCQKFYLDSGILKESRSWTRQNLGAAVVNNLTSSNMEFVNFKIKLQGEKQPSFSGDCSAPDGDCSQPRVTLLFEVKIKNSQQPAFKIQTTISQRNVDIYESGQ